MKGTLLALGGVVIALGALWIGQGLGYVKGSFMTGQRMWAYIGLVLVAVGLGVVYRVLSGRRFLI